MKIIDLQQGSEAWHAHRALHNNASEAAVMLGEHPEVPRSELLRVRATGVERDVSRFLQRIFDEGHRFEALARPLAEKVLGEDLFPCVGVEGRLSASFDGLTMDFSTGWEHKWLSATLREAMFDGCTGADLPLYHQIQMEQQCMLSGALRVLFTASDWHGDELIEARHCWYIHNPALRQRIVAGWAQFEHDLANYVPPAPIAAPSIGRAPDALPALRIELTGLVTASNLDDFRDHAIAVFHGIRTDLHSDQDFADAERAVKWCGDIEDRLAAAKQHALSQTESIDALFRAIDAISAEARSKRLELDKLVKARKEAVRGEIVQRGRDAVTAHFDAINATLGEHRLPLPATLSMDIGAAIKGKKTVTSMADAVDSVVTRAKIDASGRAESVRANVAILSQHAEHTALFPDRVALCASKSAEDLRNLVAARIAEQRQREDARIETERAKIRAEEEAKAKAEVERATVSRADEASAAAEAIPPPSPSPAPVTPMMAGAAPTPARIKLGDINARIAPLSISAEGLAQLGFTSVGTERAAKLYNASDFAPMCRALIWHLTSVSQAKAA